MSRLMASRISLIVRDTLRMEDILNVRRTGSYLRRTELRTCETALRMRLAPPRKYRADFCVVQ